MYLTHVHRRRLAAGIALLALFVVGASLFVATRPDQPDGTASCQQVGPDLARVINLNSPAVQAACADGAGFMSSLRAELRQSLGDQQHLWRRGVEDADTEEALAEWRAGQWISLRDSDSWPLPDNPDWSENPFRNISWTAGYQSLEWLAALARGYRAGDTSLGSELKTYIVDWIEANPISDPQSARAWYNGAVHRRTNTLVSVLDVLLDTSDDRELAVILGSLHAHGVELNSYLSKPSLYGHNHNLFHALALFNLANNVPILADAQQWQQEAVDRMHSLLREMVDPRDGASTEQASSYHYVAMRLFLAAQRYLAAQGDGLGRSDLTLLAEMTRFGALLPDPAGTLPAIGDTPYGSDDATAMSQLRASAAAGLTTPEAQFMLTRGTAGTRPADAVFFPSEGYAIFRPSYGETTSWADDLHVVVDMGPSGRVHGHDDAMNVLLAAYGQQLLVDSGGPYQYGIDDRRAFTEAAAHNTVIVDNGGYIEGDATIDQSFDRPSFSLVAGSHDKSPAAHHRRTVVVVKPWLVLVVDEMSATDGEPHRYDLLYHLPPDAQVEANASTALVTVGSAALGVAVDASEDVALSVRRGESDPLFGWVTAGNGKRQAAPVLDFSQRSTSGWYVTALYPSPAGQAATPMVTADRGAGAMVIEVSVGSNHWTVTLPDSGDPSVE